MSSLNTRTFHNLTIALILHPIGTSMFHLSLSLLFLMYILPAAGLSGLAFLFGLCGLCYHRSGTVLMTLLSLLALLMTFIVWVIDMVLFGVARNRYRRVTSAEYGIAVWFTLGAFAALLLGFCTSACGVFGRYRKRREAY
jgi:hypothetical protein